MNPDRWMRVLLRLYPREFRERFGGEARGTFVEAYSGERLAGRRFALVLLSAIDAVRTASAEWLDVLRSLRHPSLMFADIRYAMRHAARTLIRNPGFAASTILTLAVGIGATTAVFSVMNTALLQPLPYPHADRLVAIAQSKRGDEISLSFPDLLDFGRRARSFESIAGFAGQGLTLTEGGDPERVAGQVVTANLFPTLGVTPILGHVFAPSDDEANAAPVVAISHSLWTRKFGNDSSIVGRAITLNGVPFTVTAVMPRGFRFPDGITYGPADAWVPASQIGAGDRDNRDNHPGIVAVGLLKKGTSLENGRADLVGIASDLEKEYPQSNREVGVIVRNAVDAIVGSLSNALLLLFGAAIAVLLIACANVAGLLLTRAEARRREMSIKIALGADGVRVAANLAGEAVLLATAGGVAGAALAYTLVRAFSSTIASLPRLDTLTLDVRALAFAIGVTALVAFACSLAPMLWARRTNAQGALQARGSGGTLASRMRNAFVVGQIAMSLMLLVTASLLLRTFNEMSSRTGGIRPDGVVTFTLLLPQARYGDEASRATFARELTTRLESQPGVTGASLISTLPFSGSGTQSGISRMHAAREDSRRTDVASVTPDYFRTMGVELKRGRAFTSADDAGATPVVVVDERFAEAMWPNEDPIGKRVSGWGKEEWQIVGVVAHVKNYGVAAESRQEMYAPYAQRPSFRFSGVVRTSADASAAIVAARAALKEVDPQLAMYNARSMNDVVNVTVAGPRLAAFLSSAYALTALLVVVIGIHGAISYLVHRRTREIGVRVALGASRPNVLGLVAGQSLRLTGLGVIIGVAGGIAATRLIRDQLFGVSATDVPTYVVAVVAMGAVGLAASAVPAWRALRVSPLVALSEE